MADKKIQDIRMLEGMMKHMNNKTTSIVRIFRSNGVMSVG